jgi:hypothetical protein
MPDLVCCGAADPDPVRVMPQQPHNKLITQAARAVLRPMGLTQKGRSRTWLDDHGWWLGVVEFQPSSWSKGSYLNVGVCWLWLPDPSPVISFDLGYRVEGHVEFRSEAQFAPQARRLADRAAEEIARFRAMLPTITEAAVLLADRADGAEVAVGAGGYDGWHRWDAAVALGLAGRPDAAAVLFERVARSDDAWDWWQPVKQQAQRLHELVKADPTAFRAVIEGYIRDRRAGLKLPPMAGPVAPHPDPPDG